MEQLHDLNVADDIVLFAQRGADMQININRLAAFSSAAGLNIIAQKEFGGSKWRSGRVDYLQYLGGEIAPDSGIKLDINTLIKKAKHASAILRNLWCSIDLNFQLEREVRPPLCKRYLARIDDEHKSAPDFR